MIRISASLTKKIPIPNTQFSSQQFGASMEVEVSDADRPEAIQGRIRQLYGLLTASIDEQVAAAAQAGGAVQPSQPASAPANGAPRNRLPGPHKPNGNGSGNGNGNGNGKRQNGFATQAQQRAIFAICKDMGLDMAAVLADYNVTDARDLTVRDASQLIDALKSRQENRPARS